MKINPKYLKVSRTTNHGTYSMTDHEYVLIVYKEKYVEYMDKLEETLHDEKGREVSFEVTQHYIGNVPTDWVIKNTTFVEFMDLTKWWNGE